MAIKQNPPPHAPPARPSAQILRAIDAAGRHAHIAAGDGLLQFRKQPHERTPIFFPSRPDPTMAAAAAATAAAGAPAPAPEEERTALRSSIIGMLSSSYNDTYRCDVFNTLLEESQAMSRASVAFVQNMIHAIVSLLSHLAPQPPQPHPTHKIQPSEIPS